MFPSYLEEEKLVPSYFEPVKHCRNYLEREKGGSLLFGDEKMQFTMVRSKEKDYDMHLKSEKLLHSNQEYENFSPAIWKGKILVPSYFEPVKHCHNYLEREKSGSLLFGDEKMQFTMVRSKENDYDMYLKSETLVHNNLEHEKNDSQLFGSGKTASQLFRA